MKTTTTGLFVGDIDPVYRQKVENAYIRARAKVIEWCLREYGSHPIVEGGACLMWAVIGSIELAAEGITTMMQAGTMFWQIMPKDELEKYPTTQMINFGWQYSIDNTVSARKVLEEGGLPEMHCWLADVDRGLMIDFSTGGIKPFFDTINTTREVPQAWVSPLPPVYCVIMAGEHDSLGDGRYAKYTCEPLAIMLAIKLGRSMYGCEESPCLQAPPKFEKIINKSTDMYLQEHHKWLAEQADKGREAYER